MVSNTKWIASKLPRKHVFLWNMTSFIPYQTISNSKNNEIDFEIFQIARAENHNVICVNNCYWRSTDVKIMSSEGGFRKYVEKLTLMKQCKEYQGKKTLKIWLSHENYFHTNRYILIKAWLQQKVLFYVQCLYVKKIVSTKVER